MKLMMVLDTNNNNNNFYNFIAWKPSGGSELIRSGGPCANWAGGFQGNLGKT